jgi:hypothetical protein
MRLDALKAHHNIDPSRREMLLLTTPASNSLPALHTQSSTISKSCGRAA